MAKGKKNNSEIGTFFKVGLGFGLGAGIARMFFLILGLLFLIPGAILYYKERKKPAEERNKTTLIISLVLAIIGVVLSLGLGFSLIMNIIGDL